MLLLLGACLVTHVLATLWSFQLSRDPYFNPQLAAEQRAVPTTSSHHVQPVAGVTELSPPSRLEVGATVHGDSVTNRAFGVAPPFVPRSPSGKV